MIKRAFINKSQDKLENHIKSLLTVCEKVTGLGEIKNLKQNSYYNNLFKGETCYILGNGPSLKNEKNLEKIAGKHVFTVNQMFRSNIFNLVEPEFHVMCDFRFFELDALNKSENDTLLRMKNLKNTNNLKLILPIKYKKYIEENEIGKTDTNIYIDGRYRMFKGYSKDIKLDDYLPGSLNVVLTAIYCAIGMGFSKIILLGCDMTGIMDNYIKKSNIDVERFSHIYSYTNEERERMKKVHSSISNEDMLFSFAKMFSDFEATSQYCKKNGIILINATCETALDCLEFGNLDELLNER